MKPLSRKIELPGADLVMHDTIGLDHNKLLLQLIADTPWQQEDITVFGRTHPQPRLIAWYGDPGADYTYSGIPHRPLPWSATLVAVRRAVEQACGHRFNSVLLNYYRDQRDSMGLHADDEPELGPAPVIASLSLGENRSLYFRHKRKNGPPGIDVPLPAGCLLVMRGATQANWKHGIRKLTRPCGPRVNLTFREVRGTRP